MTTTLQEAMQTGQIRPYDNAAPQDSQLVELSPDELRLLQRHRNTATEIAKIVTELLSCTAATEIAQLFTNLDALLAREQLARYYLFVETRAAMRTAPPSLAPFLEHLNVRIVNEPALMQRYFNAFTLLNNPRLDPKPALEVIIQVASLNHPRALEWLSYFKAKIANYPDLVSLISTLFTSDKLFPHTKNVFASTQLWLTASTHQPRIFASETQSKPTDIYRAGLQLLEQNNYPSALRRFIYAARFHIEGALSKIEEYKAHFDQATLDYLTEQSDKAGPNSALAKLAAEIASLRGAPRVTQ